jgi:nucleotide-binding universal stress UspA family protein
MNGQPGVTGSPHETVLVAVDGSASSGAAVRWAAAEADRRNARLHAVHVVEPGQPEATPPDHDVQRKLDLARQSVPGRVGDWVFRSGVEVKVAVSVVTGHLAGQVARESADAALVVIGAPESRHHSDLPAALMSRCLCPVVMVGPLGDVTYLRAPAHPPPSGAGHPGLVTCRVVDRAGRGR